MSVPHRRPGLDRARGIAIVAMIGYHFAWDLSYFGLVGWDLLGDPVWLTVRAAILAAFLGIAGFAQGLKGPAFDDRFQRRLILLVGAALLVTAGSYVLFPTTFIWFGVLHCLAVSSLLARPLSGRGPEIAAGIGVVCLILPGVVGLPFFNTPFLAWTGLGTVPPVTNDWVPLLPFFGTVALGVALGGWVRRRPDVLERVLGEPAAPGPFGRDGGLSWMGRNGLAIYLIHQPVLIGAIWLAIAVGLVTPSVQPASTERARFLQDCQDGCVTNGTDADICTAMCVCFADGLGEATVASLNSNILDPADNDRIIDQIAQCQRELGLEPAQ